MPVIAARRAGVRQQRLQAFTVPGAVDAITLASCTPTSHYSLAYIFHVASSTTVKGVAVRVANSGFTNGSVKIGFASTNGASPSAVSFDQGVVTVLMAQPGANKDWVNFIFATPVTLAAANHWLIILGNDATKAGAGPVEWDAAADRTVTGSAIDTTGSNVSYSDDTTGATAWSTQTGQFVPMELLS